MNYNLPKQAAVTAVLFALISFSLQGQSYLMDGSPINDCSGFFLDSGGSSGSYGPNENFTTTICSDGNTNTHVQLNFSGIFLGLGETISFYDSDTADPAAMFDLVLPPIPGSPFIVQATAANASGCLTIVFTSDATDEGAGWSASLDCTVACQTIFADLTTTTPAVVPIDTGWIDICPGDEVIFNSAGIYPQDGLSYSHSDASASFAWNFGDGNTAMGANVSNVFEEPGGYIVQVVISDQLGCRNSNFISQRVRVSTYPTYSLSGDLDQTLCIGDTINLSAMVDTLNAAVDVSVVPNEGNFGQPGSLSDETFLPDGTGASYTSDIAFTEFLPGATLTNPEDILSLSLELEHSYGGDLDIELICPNGQSIFILDYPSGTGSTNFGEPYANSPVDGLSSDITPGVGYLYTFVNSGAGLETLSSAAGDDNYTYTTVPSEIDGETHTYDDSYFPAGFYLPQQSFAGLIGCPLNGEWTIRVQDNLGQDNGWLFEWGLTLNPSLYASLETFTPTFVDWAWEENPTIFYQDQDSIATSPINAGMVDYTFWVEDDFGCINDTTMSFQVLPQTHPDCYDCNAQINQQEDVSICEGETADLDVSPTSPLSESVSFASYDQYLFGFSNHAPAIPYASSINVNSANPLLLTDPMSQIESICVEIMTDMAGDINIFLESPSGEVLSLSNGNGGSGNNYVNTCFSPDAVVDITNSTAPFTGMFQPEGNWNALTGSQTNGDWTLHVSDDAGIDILGELVNWTITFNSENEFTYAWSPSNGLSCSDCPTPTASPSSTTTYNLNVTDSYGCVIDQQITVEIVTSLPPPVVICSQVDNNLSFDWTSIPGFDDYEVNLIVNGVASGWMGPFTGNQFTPPFLNNGTEVTFQVRVLPGINSPTNCTVEIGETTCVLDGCGPIAAIDETIPESCVGANDGQMVLEITSVEAPYEVLIDNIDTGSSDLTVTGLAVGMHTVIIRDNQDCIFVADFEITSPELLEADIMIVEEIDCHGDATGVIQAIGTGGTIDYSYSWAGPATGNAALFESLTAGDYNLIITDANNCEATASINLAEPTALSLSFTPDNPDCFNTLDGTLSVQASGGTDDYDYLWEDNSTLDNINGLGAGSYCVTVTDVNGCVIEECSDLTAPTELVIDMISAEPTSCFGFTDGTATVIASGGTGDLNYIWSDANQQISASANFLAVDTYTVQVTDEQGCIVTAETTVTEPPLLTLAFNTVPVNCNGGADGMATVLPSGGTGSYFYHWENDDITETASGLSAGAVFVTVTDDNLCETIEFIDLTEPTEAVMAAVSQSLQGCDQAAQNEATVVASGGSGSGYSYAWSDNQNTATATGLLPGNYSVTITDGNDCPAEGSVMVESLQPIEFNLITEEPTCTGFSDGAIGVNQITGGAGLAETDYSFEWSTTSNMIAIVNLAGNTSYTVTVSDQIGCQAIQTQLLIDPSPITFDIIPSPASCYLSADGQASVENIVSPNSGYNFQWDSSTGSQNQATATTLSAGIYYVTVTDDMGCSSSNSTQISQPEELLLRLDAVHLECFGDATGSITSTVDGGTSDYQYLWSNGSTSTSLENLNAGAYQLSITDIQGCETIQTIDIKQPNVIDAVASGEAASCYQMHDGLITVNTTGGTPPFQYSLDNQQFFGSSTLIGLAANDYTVIIRDANDCIFSTQATVSEPAEFVVDAGMDLSIMFGDSIELTSDTKNAQGEVETVWWEPYPGTLSCLECPYPFASPEYTIDYEVYAIDENGCEATDMLRLFVEKPKVVAVPTGFTPNGDNMNDVLQVHGLTGTKVKLFQIFDRWGELLYNEEDFEVNNPDHGWDGNFRDQPLNSGVFVWYLIVEHLDGTEEVYRGQTTLIR